MNIKMEKLYESAPQLRRRLVKKTWKRYFFSSKTKSVSLADLKVCQRNFIYDFFCLKKK